MINFKLKNGRFLRITEIVVCIDIAEDGSETVIEVVIDGSRCHLMFAEMDRLEELKDFLDEVYKDKTSRYEIRIFGLHGGTI